MEEETTAVTLLLELSCLHILSSLFDFIFVQRHYGLRIISFDEDSFNVPTTNNLNRTFLHVHYAFSTF